MPECLEIVLYPSDFLCWVITFFLSASDTSLVYVYTYMRLRDFLGAFHLSVGAKERADANRAECSEDFDHDLDLDHEWKHDSEDILCLLHCVLTTMLRPTSVTLILNNVVMKYCQAFPPSVFSSSVL